MRRWNGQEFNSLYEQFICCDELQFGGTGYYRRYRSRYKECTRRFAALAPDHPVDVLDVGGGQLALMCAELWGDRGVVSDITGTHLDYMAEHNIKSVHWNLCTSETPLPGKFDFIFFSEVIEHLPIPGYIALERLRKTLRPSGGIICTTPNLYRPRNLVYLAIGHQIFDHFRYADEDVSLGHVLEYSRDHLAWQFKKAGFVRCTVEYSQMHHWPTNPVNRPIAVLGCLLHLVPHWRDNLVATAFASSDSN